MWPFTKIDRLEKQVKSLQGLIERVIPISENQFSNNTLEKWPDFRISNEINKYATLDQVFSVVDQLCTTQKLIPIYPYIKTADKKALRELKTITSRRFYSTKGLFDIQKTITKALEDAPEADPFLEILEKPNNYMTGTEFKMLAYLYYDLAGEVFIFKNRLTEGANEGKVKELYIVPPDAVSLIVNASYPQVIKGYKIRIGAQVIFDFVPMKDMIHWKRPNPTVLTWNEDSLRGLSPLRVAQHLTEKMDVSDKRALAQLKNGAVPGIVYDEDMKGNETAQPEFDLQKQAYLRHSESTDNTNIPFFVGTKKGYIKTGLSLTDLNIYEGQKFDQKRLCNIYHVSDRLFNNDATGSEISIEIMTKQMYTNACLPIVYDYCDKLNNDLAPDFGEQYFLTPDISGITELQDDIKKLIEAIAAMPISITGNEQRALLKYDSIDDPLMNKPLARSGYVFLEDMQGEMPLESEV